MLRARQYNAHIINITDSTQNNESYCCCCCCIQPALFAGTGHFLDRPVLRHTDCVYPTLRMVQGKMKIGKPFSINRAAKNIGCSTDFVGRFGFTLFYLFVYFFLRTGTLNGHNVPFLESVSPKKRKSKAMTRIKQIAKIFKKENSNIHEEKKIHAIWSLKWWQTCLSKERKSKKAGNTEDGREFHRKEVEGKKPPLNRLLLYLCIYHLIKDYPWNFRDFSLRTIKYQVYALWIVGILKTIKYHLYASGIICVFRSSLPIYLKPRMMIT